MFDASELMVQVRTRPSTAPTWWKWHARWSREATECGVEWRLFRV